MDPNIAAHVKGCSFKKTSKNGFLESGQKPSPVWNRQGKDTVQILPRSWAPLPPRGAGVGRQATRRDEGTWAQKLVKILGQCLAAVPQAVSPCWWGPGWDRLGPGDPLISIIKGECPRGSQIAERPTKHRSRCVGGGSQPGPNRSQPVPTAPRVPQNTGPRALGPGPNGYQRSQRPTKHRSPCVGTGSQRVPKVTASHKTEAIACWDRATLGTRITTSHKTQVPVHWDRVTTGTKR